VSGDFAVADLFSDDKYDLGLGTISLPAHLRFLGCPF